VILRNDHQQTSTCLIRSTLNVPKGRNVYKFIFRRNLPQTWCTEIVRQEGRGQYTGRARSVYRKGAVSIRKGSVGIQEGLGRYTDWATA
jgi:hypothetical protein